MLVTLAHHLHKLGAFVDMERYCADLMKVSPSGTATEAWMDVCSHMPGHAHLWRVDVTARSTWGQYGNTADRPGLAAAAGVANKRARYGASVSAIAFEPLGRLAPESVETLWLLATQARDQRKLPVAPGQLHRELRLCLERALLWSTAESYIGALGRGAGGSDG